MCAKQAKTNSYYAQIQASRGGYSPSMDKNLPATKTAASNLSRYAYAQEVDYHWRALELGNPPPSHAPVQQIRRED